MRLKVDFWWAWMPKWWFFQTSFEDQTINCKQLPKVQKHTKTICFLMILRVRCFERLKKKLWKSHEKLRLKPDIHVWWMFDRFWIDFLRISDSLWPKISLRKSLGMNFGIILNLFWDHGGTLKRGWGAWCWKIALRRGEPGGAPPFWVQKWVCEPLESSQSLPKSLPNRIKVVKRNNHQRIDKVYAFESRFLVRLDANN